MNTQIHYAPKLSAEDEQPIISNTFNPTEIKPVPGIPSGYRERSNSQVKSPDSQDPKFASGTQNHKRPFSGLS